MINSTEPMVFSLRNKGEITEPETCPGYTRTGMGVVMLPPSIFRALDSIVSCDTAAADFARTITDNCTFRVKLKEHGHD
uniref:hypothetical protein n=1 Tax=Scandinavium goeteborgense TaxID=1851514 RepID=UPI0013568D5C|nr:hypothetical protein [Scandinavium goeteborgense]